MPRHEVRRENGDELVLVMLDQLLLLFQIE
jgi:hypothetical protein